MTITLDTKPATIHSERVPILPFDLGPVEDTKVNRSAVERRAATISTRRTVKKEYQAAWLLQAVQNIDLTTLSGDDTPGTVRRLCAKARYPIRADLLKALGVDKPITTGAVCVYHSMVETAVDALHDSGIPVAAVVTAGHGTAIVPGARVVDAEVLPAHVVVAGKGLEIVATGIGRRMRGVFVMAHQALADGLRRHHASAHGQPSRQATHHLAADAAARGGLAGTRLAIGWLPIGRRRSATRAEGLRAAQAVVLHPGTGVVRPR